MAPASSRRTLVIFSQVYIPDPAAVGQHMSDAAAEMVRRGWRVIVYTSARGYYDASIRYPSRETIRGVDVRRLPLSSFGKRSMGLRIVAGLSFMVQCAVRGVFVRHLGAILVSTAPPMCAWAALLVAKLRRVPLKFWAMDLNPDQLIAMGRISANGLTARVFRGLNGLVLRQADDVIALDRFMVERLKRNSGRTEHIHIIPPWPHEDHIEPVSHEENPFRREHDLEQRFVLMYSGNHGLTTPVTTLLQAALRLEHLERPLFLFIGGGYGKLEVERTIAEHGDRNIRSLPYQPLDTLRYSLSAADVHLVTMNDEVLGIIHPGKIYGAMAAGRPMLSIGPRPSHLSELIERYRIGWHVENGDVDAAVAAIEEAINTDPARLALMGQRARQAVTDDLGLQQLCGRFADVIERDPAADGLPTSGRTAAS